MMRWAVDDGGRPGKIAVVDIDTGVERTPEDYDDFIRLMQELRPAEIYIESTAMSYDLRRWDNFLVVAQSTSPKGANSIAATRIFTLSPRITSWRRKGGKSDMEDARTIARLVREGLVHFSEARPRGRHDVTNALRERITKAVVPARRTKYDPTLPQMAQALADLPDPKEAPEPLRKGKRKVVYLPTHAYSLAIAARIVLEAGGDWREFRRQVGNFGAGYPSLLRSNYYKHWLGKTRTKERMRDLDRAVRWVWDMVRARQSESPLAQISSDARTSIFGGAAQRTSPQGATSIAASPMHQPMEES